MYCRHQKNHKLWERNLQVTPRCFTHPWIRNNEETSGRNKNSSKVVKKKIGYSVKNELWGSGQLLADSRCVWRSLTNCVTDSGTWTARGAMGKVYGVVKRGNKGLLFKSHQESVSYILSTNEISFVVTLV